MRIAVLGAGALGSLVGALLSREHEVVLVGRRSHVSAIRKSGLRAEGKTEGIYRIRAATSCKGLGKQDLVLVAVKSYDTEAAVKGAKPLMERGTLFLTLQNGPLCAEKIARVVGRGCVLAGWTTHGAMLAGNGRVIHSGRGDTVIGELGGRRSARARDVAKAMTKSGIPTKVSGDIASELWAKCVVNAAINPLTALLGCDNGELAGSAHLRKIVSHICEEGAAVLAAMDMGFTSEELERRVWRVVSQTSRNRSSMLRDMERGRRTEIEDITGALCDAARRLGVRAPINTALLLLVGARQRGRLELK